VSHYSLDELIELWRREKLTTEQMIGQILLILKEVDRRLKELRRERGSAAVEPPGNAPQ